LSPLLKRFFTILSLIFGGLFFLIVLAVGILLFQLSRGPLNLDFLKSSIIEKVLTKSDTLDFETLQLSWESVDSPLRLEGLNIRYAQGHQKTREAFLEKVQCNFGLKKLLQLKAVPEEVVIEGARITIHSFKGEVSEDRYKANLSFKIINNLLKKTLDLKSVLVTDSTLEIKSQKTPIIFDLSARIAQRSVSPVTIQGKISAKNQGGAGEIITDIAYQENVGDIGVSITVSGFDSDTFDDIVPEVFLQNLTFTDLSSTLSYSYSLKTGEHAAYLKGTLCNADVTQSAYWNAPLLFPKLAFEGELKGKQFTIKELETSVQDIPMSISTRGTIDEKMDQLHLETHVTVRKIPFKDLAKVWPKGAANSAREWITENITEGTSPKASLIMKSHFDFSAQKTFFTLDSLSGTIEVQNALLSYVETMPKINKLMATAHFDAEHFDIEIKGGETHGLKISSGELFIGKFSDKVPHLALDVNIVGGLGDVLSLIDHKPLEYAKDYGLDPETSTGQTQAKLKMTFPLLSPFETSKIETIVSAKVTNATLRDLANLNVVLSKGDLEINVGSKQVSVKGHAFLNGEESQLLLTHQEKNNALDLKVQTQLTPTSLSKLWHEADVFFKGTAPLSLHYQSDAKKRGTLALTINLKGAEVNTLVYKKDFGIPSTLVVDGVYEQGRLRRIEKVSFKDENQWVVGGSADFSSEDGALSTLNLVWSHKEKNILKATYLLHKNGARFLDLTAGQIDLKNFMDTDLTELSNPQHLKEHPIDAEPMRVEFEAQKVVFGKELGLLNNKLTLFLEKGLVQNLSYTGLTEEAVKGKRDVFAQIYQTKKGALRKLRVQTEQGGAFLRALDIFDNIRGGRLKLIAYHDPAFRKKEWVGKMKVRDFTLLKAPLLTRIFSLFPTGGAELTSGEGMKFKLLKMRFGASSKAFRIHASRAHGISIGFNLSGEIEKGDKGRLNLQGTMIPLYVVNTLVSKIPLIGEVISGGKNEGLFSVAFYIAGRKDKPEISANPFSIITPGITRQLFPSQETSLTRDDNWIDEEDTEGDVFDQEFNEK